MSITTTVILMMQMTALAIITFIDMNTYFPCVALTQSAKYILTIGVKISYRCMVKYFLLQ